MHREFDIRGCSYVRVYDFSTMEKEILENLYNINTQIGFDTLIGISFEDYVQKCCKVATKNYALTTHLFFNRRLVGDLEFMAYIYHIGDDLYACPNLEFIDMVKEKGYEYAYNKYLDNIDMEV